MSTMKHLINKALRVHLSHNIFPVELKGGTCDGSTLRLVHAIKWINVSDKTLDKTLRVILNVSRGRRSPS
jgi:hypothetical protein